MAEYDLDRVRYFNVDGRPAIASGMVAAKLVNGYFVAVLPSAVRAEGVDSRKIYPLRVVTFSD